MYASMAVVRAEAIAPAFADNEMEQVAIEPRDTTPADGASVASLTSAGSTTFTRTRVSAQASADAMLAAPPTAATIAAAARTTSGSGALEHAGGEAGADFPQVVGARRQQLKAGHYADRERPFRANACFARDLSDDRQQRVDDMRRPGCEHEHVVTSGATNAMA